jgi:hydrogenase-4 component F
VTSQALAEMVVAAPLAGAAITALSPRRLTEWAARAAGVATAGLALWATAATLAHPGTPEVGTWLIVDPAGAIMIGVIGVIGAVSLATSATYLSTSTASVVQPEHKQRLYYSVLLVFLAVLLAVPLAGNLGEAWLLVEATTAFSALLIGFSGRPRSLEAGWKYLILTSLGLGVALLGIVLLAQGLPHVGLSHLTWRALAISHAGYQQTTTAYILVLVGLAAKIGWAPVHNWLPDAHSEAPPPVSALLSAALLPAVLVIAWRVERSFAPQLGHQNAARVLIGFGLLSLLVAVPFLWQRLPWKRLLAYSSLEHMGVITLGFGFASPLALAGVVIHIVGHAIAKALGFYAATPLLAHDPRAAGHPVTGIARTCPGLGATMGISLGALSGLPPSPLFISEVLILAGGYQSGHPVAATAAAVLLALGFLGLSHALVDSVAGKARRRDTTAPTGLPTVVVLTSASVVLLLLLSIGALTLPGSAVIHTLSQDIR